MEADCDRCLEPARCQVDSDFELYYRPVADGYGEEVVLDRFIELGVRYVRHFNQYSFKSWQTCWATTSRAEVEARLRKDDTEFEWVDGDWLRTFQRRPAVLRDPVSKAEILFPSFGIFHLTFIKHIAEDGLAAAAERGRAGAGVLLR
jgi:hypothetical protein